MKLKPAIRAIVFDLDGTLIDSRRDIAEAVNHTLATSGREILSESVIGSFVGDGAAALIQRATGLAAGEPELTRLLQRFRTFYTANATVFTRVYPGVRETLSRLATLPYAVALCTNKPRSTTERVLLELDLAHHFEVVVCADDLPVKKPDPGPLLHIAQRLGVDATEIVMVGDGPQDVNCGKSAGARTVGVTYGIKDRREVAAAQPDALIDDLEGLWRFLEQHCGAVDGNASVG